MTLLQATALLVTGTVAGFDLVSGPQVLLARPIVVGALSGAILGDVPAGLLVGGTMELFALEVLPIGATRYPDHGPGIVGGVWLTHAVGLAAAGYGVLLALACSELGGWTLTRLRRANGSALARAAEQLDAGVAGTAGRLQLGGALRDLGRALALTAIGLLGAAFAGHRLPQDPIVGRDLWLVLVACALAGAVAGAIRTAGRTVRGIVLTVALLAGWFLAMAVGVIPAWEVR